MAAIPGPGSELDDDRLEPVVVGRYVLHRQIARGGMATIHIARLIGDQGFSRVVAAKRLLPEFAEDDEFVTMFLDEARIASKVHHRNVVPVLDVVATGEEVILVQEYVHGVPLHWLLRTARRNKTRIPVKIAVSIASQVLEGLHAAHTTTDETGAPLTIVHRDVSPQNIMIAVDGTARLLDFGVAKATLTAHVTREGTFQGKLAYSAPEQIVGRATLRSDIYSLSVVLWEMLVGQRMHQTPRGDAELVSRILSGQLPSVSEDTPNPLEPVDKTRRRQIEALEPVLVRGLALDQTDRYASAGEMERALAQAVRPATTTEVATWLRLLGEEFLLGRDKVLASEEASWRKSEYVVPRRAATLSTELRAHTTVDRPTDDEPEMVITSSHEPNRRKRALWLALLGLLGIVAIVAVVVSRRSSPSPRPPVVPVAPTDQPAAAAAAPVTPAPAAPAAAPEPAPVAPAPVAPAPVPTDEQVTDQNPAPPGPEDVEPTPTGVGETSAVSTSRTRKRGHPTRPRPDVKPPATLLPETPPAKKDDCTPPYFFVGEKKVFKPQCL